MRAWGCGGDGGGGCFFFGSVCGGGGGGLVWMWGAGVGVAVGLYGGVMFRCCVGCGVAGHCGGGVIGEWGKTFLMCISGLNC